MSLFVCTNQECRAVENTALSQFWWQRFENRGTDLDGQCLCSECLTGTWHDRFPKVAYDGSQRVQWVDGVWINQPDGSTGSILRTEGRATGGAVDAD